MESSNTSLPLANRNNKRDTLIFTFFLVFMASVAVGVAVIAFYKIDFNDGYSSCYEELNLKYEQANEICNAAEAIRQRNIAVARELEEAGIQLQIYRATQPQAE